MSMPAGGIGKVWERLRVLVGAPARPVVGDGELLEQFVGCHDQAAFQALVERHGPLVLGTCRRLLRNSHAAEDAFQAVFLVLARRAAALERRPSLAGWLHGVAFRVALRARSRAARRRAQEQPMPEPDMLTQAGPDPTAASDRRELEAVLDTELQRLPARYRELLVLCYLQGKTNEQAARELGQPPGSMSRQLARARELLRDRLAHRGVTATALLIGPALADATAAVPSVLTQQAVQAALLVAAGRSAAAAASAEAVSLATETIGAMQMIKLKMIAGLLLIVCAVAAGAAVFAYQATQPQRQALLAGDRPAEKKPAEPHPTLRLDHNDPVSQVALSADGRWLATQADQTLTLWDAATGKELRRLPLRDGKVQWTCRLAFSPDSRTLAWAGSIAQADGVVHAVELFDVASGKHLRSLGETRTGKKITAFTFSPDGRTLAAGNAEGLIELWDPAGGKLRTQLTNTRGREINALAFTPDGKTLAVAALIFYEQRNGVFLPTIFSLWDLTTNREIRHWNAHRDRVTAAVFSPDGKLLATAGDKDATVRLWELESGKEIRSWAYFDSGPYPPLVFSPDGRLLAGGPKNSVVRVWDALAGAEVPRPDGHEPGISAFAYSSDGRLIATGYDGKRVVVRDVTELARTKSARLENGERERLWEALAADDRATAYQALARLAADADGMIQLLQQRLAPRPATEVERIAKLVADLASDQFAIRQKASDDLEKMTEVPAARAALEKALAGKPPLEVQQRLERLLAKFNAPGLQLRWLRIVQGLEQLDAATAPDLLKIIADGKVGPRPAADAKAALERMKHR
jgi:RNA polymerase sigma factor (sigma-70 family)